MFHGHSIGRKLNLLIVPPLVAAVLVAVPFLLGQTGDAGSAAATAESARQVRELGNLIWELQRERVLTAAHLASPGGDGENLKRQHRNVDAAAEDVRAALGTEMSDELTTALVRLGSLTGMRQNAVRGSASFDGVARTYHAAITAVIESLRLVPQQTGDAEGTRQLTALEALLRDGRFGSVPWDRAVLAQADVGPEIPGAVALALEFDAPVSVPSTLGIVDEPSEGEVRVTTRGGYPKTRKPTAHESERFEKVHEVGVVVDLASRSVRILSVSEPVFCRVGHPEGWSK